MKKIICAALALSLLFSLAACGSAPAAETAAPDAAEATAEVIIETEAPAPAETSALVGSAAEAEKLAAILDDISASVTIGTAGSSLRAAIAAAALLDWASVTTLGYDEVKSATADWLMPKGNDAQVEFAGQLEAVDFACTELQKENAADLLESAGCSDSGYPWNGQAFELAGAVMDAAGLR